MTSWKQLTKTRQSLMSLIEISIVIMAITLLVVAVLGYKAQEKTRMISNAAGILRVAQDQLDAYKLGTDAGIAGIQLQNIQSLSPLPNSSGTWSAVASLQNQANQAVTSMIETNKNWKALNAPAMTKFSDLETKAKAIIQSKKSADVAQDVLLAAKGIRDWILNPPVDATLQSIEANYLTEKVTLADNALSKSNSDPAIAELATLWNSWNDASEALLKEEKSFVAQRKIANDKLMGYSDQLSSETTEWLEQSRSASIAFLAFFALLVCVIIYCLQLMKKNPHLNTMFANKGTEAVQAELGAITEQVDLILSNVDRAWSDSRAELNVVSHALEDSTILESQTKQIKSDIDFAMNFVIKGLQELEHSTRATNPASADRIGNLIGDAQAQESKIQQSLEGLAESGMSIREELHAVRKMIRKLMTETLALKQEGEGLEESSDTIQTT